MFVSIVERGRTDSHGDIGPTPARAREIKQTALGADGNRSALIVYGIAEKIRSGIEFAQAGLSPLHLLLHGREQSVGFVGQRGRSPSLAAGDQRKSENASERARPRSVRHGARLLCPA